MALLHNFYKSKESLQIKTHVKKKQKQMIKALFMNAVVFAIAEKISFFVKNVGFFKKPTFNC